MSVDMYKVIITYSLCVPVSKTTLIAPWQQRPKCSVKRRGRRKRDEKEEGEERREEMTAEADRQKECEEVGKGEKERGSPAAH